MTMPRRLQRRNSLLVVASLCGILCSDSLAEPVAALPRPKITSPIEDATANPQIFVPPPKDLQLTPENSAKSEAIARYVEGLAFQEQGEPLKAFDSFTKSIQLDPTNIALATHIAYFLARKGDIAEGVGILKDSAKALPKNADPQLSLAYFYLRFLRKPDLAEPYAQKALSLNPEDPRSYAYLVEIYLVQEQEKKAEAILEKALKAKNAKPEFWLGLGDLYRKILMPEEKNPPAATVEKVSRFYDKATEAGPQKAAVLNRVANFYSSTKQVKKAIPLYLKAIDLAPDDSDLLNSVRENLAMSWIEADEKEKGIAVLKEMVAIDPTRWFTQELLGDIYFKSDDFENALKYYEQCLTLNPNSSQQYLRVTDLLLSRVKDSKRAIEVIQKARERFPDLPIFAYTYALALRSDKQLEASVTAFETAEKEAQSGDMGLLSAEFYFNYGISADMSGKQDQAATLFKRSIELDPGFADAYNYLGYMWVDKDLHLEEAGELIKRAVELDPTNGAYLDSLGWYYYKVGSFQRALNELLRACEALEALKQPDAVVYDHVSDAYQQLGNSSQAIAYLEMAVKLDPDNKKLSDKLDALKKKLTAGR